EGHGLGGVALEDADDGGDLGLVPGRGDAEHLGRRLTSREVILAVEALRGAVVREDFEAAGAALEHDPPQTCARPSAVAGDVEAQLGDAALPFAGPDLGDLAAEGAVRLVQLLALGLLALDDGGDDRGDVGGGPVLTGDVVEAAAGLLQPVEIDDQLLAA